MPPKKRILTTVPSFAPVQPVAKKQRNHFAIVLDSSSSMDHLTDSARRTVDQIVAAIKEGAALFNQETTISLYTFADSVKRLTYRVPAAQVGPLVGYAPYGNTALFDGVGQAITDFQLGGDADDVDTSFVLMIVTDGEENRSRFFGATASNYGYLPGGKKDIVQLMRTVQATDRYTITFQLPARAGRSFAQQYGIPLGNVREWEQSDAGMREVERSASVGTNSYFQARSVGQKSVDSFYVQTDLSNLKKSDLKKLSDVSSRFKAWTVDKEADVKTFVEGHGKKFVIGSLFYALTKKEKVQPQKQVLIMEKGNKAVYAGVEARNLIGLPQGSNATVEPGNHANYDIYVQSTSVNRKLVRGTKVLFDTSLSVDLAPTWDHVGAQLAADAKKNKITF